MIPFRARFICLLSSALLWACTGSSTPGAGQPPGLTDCNLQEGPCSVLLVPGVSLTLDVSPKPLRSMTDLDFTVTLSDGRRPIDGARVELELTMPGMYMGENRHTLSGEGQGIYRTHTVLPRCPSGKSLWRTDLEVEVGETDGEAWFLFSVK